MENEDKWANLVLGLRYPQGKTAREAGRQTVHIWEEHRQKRSSETLGAVPFKKVVMSGFGANTFSALWVIVM